MEDEKAETRETKKKSHMLTNVRPHPLHKDDVIHSMYFQILNNQPIKYILDFI